MENTNTNKVNIEVKKMNKVTKEIEWTETLEIPCSTNSGEISHLEKQVLENELNKKKNNDRIDNHSDDSYDDSISEIKLNPFYQPQMNTIEFEQGDNVIVANISKNDNSPVDHKDELLALTKLFENNIINEEEFEDKKKIITENDN